LPSGPIPPYHPCLRSGHWFYHTDNYSLLLWHTLPMLSERKFGWPEWDQVIPLNFLSGCFAISSRYPEEGSRASPYSYDLSTLPYPLPLPFTLLCTLYPFYCFSTVDTLVPPPYLLPLPLGYLFALVTLVPTTLTFSCTPYPTSTFSIGWYPLPCPVFFLYVYIVLL
jgi:hypothetical protein